LNCFLLSAASAADAWFVARKTANDGSTIKCFSAFPRVRFSEEFTKISPLSLRYSQPFHGIPVVGISPTTQSEKGYFFPLPCS
jgi:hypothetical protein